MATYAGDVNDGGSYAATSKNRTGTLPFMAVELILDASLSLKQGTKWKPVPHLLRHDYESLFYVSFWAATGLKRPGDDDELTKALAAHAKDLDTGTLQQLAAYKTLLCTKGFPSLGITLSELVQILDAWFCAWVMFFGIVYGVRDARARDDWWAKVHNDTRVTRYDDETIDGLFTRDALRAALTPAMPSNLLDEDYSDEEPRSSPCPEARPYAGAGPSKTVEKSREKPTNEQNSKESADEKNPKLKQDDKDNGSHTKEAKKSGSKSQLPDENFDAAAIEYRSRLRSSKK